MEFNQEDDVTPLLWLQPCIIARTVGFMVSVTSGIDRIPFSGLPGSLHQIEHALRK